MTRDELTAQYPDLKALEVGTKYIASRPFNERCRKVYPVSIHRMQSDPHKPLGVDVVVDGLNYEAAKDLVNAFNNGTTSFDGRVW